MNESIEAKRRRMEMMSDIEPACDRAGRNMFPWNCADCVYACCAHAVEDEEGGVSCDADRFLQPGFCPAYELAPPPRGYRWVRLDPTDRHNLEVAAVPLGRQVS